MHANSGVEKGMAAGGKPVEIMGMMLGRPDTETPNALIVTDVSGCRTPVHQYTNTFSDSAGTLYSYDICRALLRCAFEARRYEEAQV